MQDCTTIERVIKALPNFQTSPNPQNPTNFQADRLGKQKTWLVATGGVEFFVWDNGGEIGVEIINSGKIPRFAPIIEHEGTYTTAFRVAALLRGDEIDFQTTLDDADFEEKNPAHKVHHFSLINVYSIDSKGSVWGTWIQDFNGTFEEALVQARKIEDTNSNMIEVAVTNAVAVENQGGPTYARLAKLGNLRST